MIGPGKKRHLNDLLRIEHEAFQTDRMTRGAMQQTLRKNGTTLFLLVNENDQGGCDGYILVHVPNRGGKQHVGTIHSYAVHSSARGTGLGEKLIDAAIHMAGYAYHRNALRTEVRADNPYACARYEKCGFKRVGNKKAYYSDGCNSFTYERPI